LHHILDKTKTEPAQYISCCFEKEKLFPHFDFTDLVEHDVFDMLTFLLFGVLCILVETEGKLILIKLLFYSVIIAFSGNNTDKLMIRKKYFALTYLRVSILLLSAILIFDFGIVQTL